MLHDLLRKHRKLIYGILCVIIIPSFILFFGAGDFSSLTRVGGSENEGPVIVQVGEAKVTLAEVYSEMQGKLQQLHQQNPDATMMDIVSRGEHTTALRNQIARALIENEAIKSGLNFDESFLQEQLRKSPQFLKEDGSFDAETYNAWVESNIDMNWKEYYANLSDSVRQHLLMQKIVASARVLESDVRKQFEEDYTKLKVKYAAIEPKIEPTEEEIKAFYDANPEQFKTQPKRTVDFVKVPLIAPKPEIIDALLQRARAGEDFSALAKEYSKDTVIVTDSLLPWTAIDATVPQHQQVLATTTPGSVSDPVEAFGSYFIYKVDEERTKEGTDIREVQARQIVVRPTLSPEERKTREQTANEIATKVKADGDIAAAATAAGLTVETTGLFGNEDPQIANVSARDQFAFRRATLSLTQGAVSDPIAGEENLYVAKVSEIVEPAPRTFDEAREDVVKAKIQETQMSPEYRATVEALAKEIPAKAKTLTELQTAYPDLAIQVQEAPEFSVREFNYGMGLFWNPQEVYQACAKVEPGVLAGPISDFLGKTYFLEVVSKTPPDDATWTENEKTLRQMAQATAQRNRSQDYMAALMARATAEYPINPEFDQMILELVAPESAPTEATPVPATGAPAATSTDAAPAAEATPAPVVESAPPASQESTTAPVTEAPAAQ